MKKQHGADKLKATNSVFETVVKESERQLSYRSSESAIVLESLESSQRRAHLCTSSQKGPVLKDCRSQLDTSRPVYTVGNPTEAGLFFYIHYLA